MTSPGSHATSSLADRHKLPPGPRGHFLAGSGREYQRDPLTFLTNVNREYGDVARYRLGPWRFYLFNDPDHIKHIVVDNDSNYGGFVHDPVLTKVLGRSLFMSGGDVWRRHRRMMQPVFHRERIKDLGLGSITTGYTVEMLDQWRTFEQRRQPLDLLKEMMALTLRVAVKTLFGAGIGAEARTISGAVSEILDYMAYRLTNFPLGLLPPVIPTARNRRFMTALRTLEETVDRIVAERRRGNEDTGDLLSTLLLARDEATDYGMDDRQIRDEMMGIMFMGHEPTANALTWTWYLLSQHPAVERRLHDELAAVLDGRTPTVEDLPGLAHTRRVIEEAMRLYPPGWVLGRKALGDDAIGGYHVPANTVVVFSPYLTHRHPAFWDKPEEFDPDRFTRERSVGRPRFAYYPMGGGPRTCIGSHFASIESALIVATIAQRYRLRLAPGHRVELDTLITLRSRYGMSMTLERR